MGGCAIGGPRAIAAERGATPGRAPAPAGIDPTAEGPCTATDGEGSQGASTASPERGLRERPSSQRPPLLSVFRPLPNPWRSPDIGGRLGSGAPTRGLSQKRTAETAPGGCLHANAPLALPPSYGQSGSPPFFPFPFVTLRGFLALLPRPPRSRPLGRAQPAPEPHNLAPAGPPPSWR